MKIFSFIAIVFLLLVPRDGYSQEKHPALTFSSIDNIKDYVSDNFLIDNKILDTLCIFTTAFVRFSISEQGNISNFGVTTGTPKFIRDALEKAFQSTEGHWIIRKSEKNLCKTIFILPVVLSYDMACREGNGALDLNITVERRSREYRKLDATARNSSYAVLNILDFDNQRVSQLQCRLLSPISFSANKH